MGRLVLIALVAAAALSSQKQQAPPQFNTVGVRGAIDSGGYSAGVAEKAQSRLARDLETVASRLPCPRSPEQKSFVEAVALYEQGQTDHARQIITKSLVTYPHSPLLLIGRGALLYNDGYPPEALSTFLAAARANPKSGDAYLFIGRLAAIPSLVDPAALSREAGNNAQARFAYATSLLTAGQEQPAETALHEVITADPKLAEAYAQLAAIDARHSHISEAISEYRSALALDPTLTEAHYRLAQLYFHNGQKESGEKELAEQQRQRHEHPTAGVGAISCDAH